jgi:hypothetical protein
MVIPALALLASSFMAATAPPLRLVEPKKAFAVPMFHPRSEARRSEGLRLLHLRAQPSGASPSFKCHIGVIKADPEIDPKMVVEAPAIDPKIVRRSVCSEPSND